MRVRLGVENRPEFELLMSAFDDLDAAISAHQKSMEKDHPLPKRRDIAEVIFLLTFLVSTPLSVFLVFVCGEDREVVAIANSYGFSMSYCALYAYPLVCPFLTHSSGLKNRIHHSMYNWIVFLTCFTQICFQIPHNVFVNQLKEHKGGIFEWPFYSYGLSDNRWNEYSSGLAPEVWLINLNDAGLGILVAAVFLWQMRKTGCWGKPSKLLLLITVFRDATLFRETIEYMWDHHRLGYPYTTMGPMRSHAIACLWLINIMWIIAPIITVVWAWQQWTEDTLVSTRRRIKRKKQ